MAARIAPRFTYLLAASLPLSVAFAACSDDEATTSTSGTGGSGASSTSTESSSGGNGEGAGFVGSGGSTQAFEVQPVAQQVLDVAMNAQTPTLSYTATLDGSPVNAGWAVDKGNVGIVGTGPSSSAEFIPSGKAGGLVKLTASLGAQKLEREILVRLTGSQNGYDPNNPLQVGQVPTSVADLTAGGGVGGVGGEGLGPGVLDPALVDALANPVGDGQAQNLQFLYPYDGTVWPRGLLAPNLMWRWSVGDADAIRIELESTTGSFRWTGTFARPAILQQTGGAFKRHPIPQDVWKAATDTTGGTDRLRVRLTIARNGQAYGPIEQLWTIAPARLSGTIYYASYGTNLAKNFTGAVGGDGTFGGAILSIRAGDAGPQLTAGATGTSAECRVCHSVSADGSRLVVQRGLTADSSLYELSPNGAVQSLLANPAEFPAITSDGAKMLAPNGQLYGLPDSSVVLGAGVTATASALGTPAFSPNDQRVAFGPMVSGLIANPRQKLVVMDFDNATNSFTNPVVVVDYTGEPAQRRPGWPAFFPDGNSIIYHSQYEAGIDGLNVADLRTRKGAKAELAWVSATDPAQRVALNQLNGRNANGQSYLPQLEAPINLSCTGDGAQVGGIDNTHADDVNLNYEATVGPVATGGYAWVIFTSRRLYGNVAEIPPFCSDPRGVNHLTNITTKKLWVAAVDVTGTPAADASHPAFYLPAQELLAGNSRGFWAKDPCKSDGLSCETGDECCNGFCQPDANGDLVCSPPPPGGCSQPQESCETAADCCDATNICIGGVCSIKPPA